MKVITYYSGTLKCRVNTNGIYNFHNSNVNTVI